MRVHELSEANVELAIHRDHLEELVKERTSELEKAKERAETANRIKSDFLANISHEIRTPMNAILGFTEIMKGRVSDPKLSHYLRSIYSNANSLLMLINDILDLSKVEAGKLKPDYLPVSLHEIFNEMYTMFEYKIKEKGLDFIMDIHPELPELLLLDKHHLRQILINLIGNGIKFTETGYIRLWADFRSDKIREGDLILSVEDSGIGVPEGQRESIFDAFFQVEGQKKSEFGGTGLGLAIVRRLIEMMDGEITVTSEVGRGTAFNIVIKNVKLASVDSSGFTGEKEINFNPVDFEPRTTLIKDKPAVMEEAKEKAFDGPIVPPPVHEMAVLYELAMGGDMNGILQRASCMEELDIKYLPFFRKLRKFAEGYQDEELLAFVVKYMGEDDLDI